MDDDDMFDVFEATPGPVKSKKKTEFPVDDEDVPIVRDSDISDSSDESDSDIQMSSRPERDIERKESDNSRDSDEADNDLEQLSADDLDDPDSDDNEAKSEVETDSAGKKGNDEGEESSEDEKPFKFKVESEGEEKIDSDEVVIKQEGSDVEADSVESKPDVKSTKKEESMDAAETPASPDVEAGSSKAGEKRPADLMEDDSDEDDDGTGVKKAKLRDDVELLKKYLPQVKIEHVDVPEDAGFTHQVSIPIDGDVAPLKPLLNPVRTYNFKLDKFQERAITIVDNYQSVLVSAHTSAGKTTVAEYAIAKGLRDSQRVIYTTPIKALSNQKYREFYEAFQDVGLITGDVTINPAASCLIMTTEILRNMLYRGSEIMREVGWVVFDEIHYMRDKERGVVWEETLILLPHKTHYVFLSATIPNAIEFAQWITFMHLQPCHVIHTDFRPVPLHHYLYPVGGEGIHLVVDEQGTFREDGFSTAMGYLQSSEGTGGARKSKPMGQKGEESPCHKVIKMAMENDLAPIIVFSFSKKDCEAYALQLSSLDFNNSDDKDLVEEVFTNAIDVLNKDDQKLPQVENLLPLLKRGIGIHHGGLLPLLKETIEILFAEGLIKVLFATETFAMGLNMPARTVLFTNVRKFDGKTYRWLTSGEYIQMSGRAGRRSIDDKGISIVMIDEKITSNVGRSLLKGQADPINSAFHLTYNMVLNLMRVEEINPEFMMERSFFQFQNYNKVPTVIAKLTKAQNDYEAIEIPNESEVAAYYNLRGQLDGFVKEFQEFITTPKYIVPFLQPGRMVYVKKDGVDFRWGVVVNFKKVDNSKNNPMKYSAGYIVEVLLHVSNSTSGTKFTTELRPPHAGERGEMKVVPVSFSVIQKVSQIRLYISNDLRPADRRLSVLKSIEEVNKRFPDGVPLLDPVQDMKIKDKNFHTLIKSIAQFEQRLTQNPIHNSPDEQRLYQLYERRASLFNKVQEAKQDLKEAKSLLQMDELKCRKRVLRRLGYSAEGDVIQLKGRVACELSSADELLLTEMIFNGTFVDLEPAKAAALLSCLVCDERSKDTPKLTDDLSGALKTMQEMARQIAKVSKECKLDIDEDAYVEQFKPYLMDVVFEWCRGASFSKLCEMSEIFEGGIIRCMRRLEELLRQMSLAAKVIGNKDLEDKFNEGVRLLKRDIVFAASLYL